MNKDDIKKYIVCINGGSGVIFQPMDASSTYILTAKHVFEDIDTGFAGTVKIEYYEVATAGFKEVTPFALKPDVNYFPHPVEGTDIALLKIDRLDTPADLLLKEDVLHDDHDYLLAGFPQLRRSAKGLNRIRLDSDVTILQDKEFQRREADISKNPNLKELKGQSGGGFFKIKDKKLFVAGIQAQIAAEDEQLGKVEFTPIEVFGEIILSNQALLEQLVPYYMKGFGCLKENAFVLPYDLETKTVIGKITKVINQKLTAACDSDFTPMCIKNSLGESQLLMSGQDPQLLYLKSLWVLWLELMAMVAVATGKTVVKADFNELFNKLRLLHSETENDFWVEHLYDVGRTDFGSLADDGLVIISSRNVPRPGKYILDKAQILDEIGWVREEYEDTQPALPSYGPEAIDIHCGTSFPYDKFKFIHIEYFKRKLIVEDFNDYAELSDPKAILNLLKQKYEQYIK